MSVAVRTQNINNGLVQNADNASDQAVCWWAILGSNQ
jgi:hypothetical protein